MTETSVPLGAASVILPSSTEVTFPTRPRLAARAPGPPRLQGVAPHQMVPSRTVPSRNAPGAGTGLRRCRRTRTSRWWRWPGSPRTLPGPAPWRDHLRPGSSGPDVVGTIRSVHLRTRCRPPVRTGLPWSTVGGGGQDRRLAGYGRWVARRRPSRRISGSRWSMVIPSSGHAGTVCPAGTASERGVPAGPGSGLRPSCEDRPPAVPSGLSWCRSRFRNTTRSSRMHRNAHGDQQAGGRLSDAGTPGRSADADQGCGGQDHHGH